MPASQTLCLGANKVEGSREDYVRLCRLRGIVVDAVEEENDLGETKLMASAAEGRSALPAAAAAALRAVLAEGRLTP